ncbi:hypothetical protein IP90_00492 [Luteimonas cucumeris]|uniref:Uncharacterized protein n=1 Tax=Luteimonas cucumeris TaxID=985012 RepID=A0A562LF43_9GAMM|nr:hypothetical protein [Luteimonas cucumeris]TWI06227.1 hypothetical protein IP90_00492 [Luteimonas cucumeris]
MSNRRAIVIAALVVIVAGLIAVLTVRTLAGRNAAPVAATDAPVATSVAPPAETATETPAPTTDEAPPPWATSDAASDAAQAATSTTATATDPVRERQLRELQQAMKGVIAESTQRSAATYQHLSKALDTLEQMNDPTVTAQINLDAVRNNLDVSMRMQALAQQLQQIMTEADSPERKQRLDATMAQFRMLQSQLRSDVSAAGSSLPAPAAPTRAPAASSIAPAAAR